MWIWETKWIWGCVLLTARVIADHALCGSHLKGKKAAPMTVPTWLSTIYLAAFFGGTTSHTAFPCYFHSILTDSCRVILQILLHFSQNCKSKVLSLALPNKTQAWVQRDFSGNFPLFFCRSRGLPLTIPQRQVLSAGASHQIGPPSPSGCPRYRLPGSKTEQNQAPSPSKGLGFLPSRVVTASKSWLVDFLVRKCLSQQTLKILSRYL